jgi:predicted nucleotidyltransferase
MQAMLPVLASDQSYLDDVVRRILRVSSPLAIVVFGSQARGDIHAASDLDLLIVDRDTTKLRHRRSIAYRMALLGIDHDIDIVVYTPPEIQEWANVPNAFITTILREGKVLYEDRGGLGQRLVG